ncbi:MAG: hypothetical protein FWG72_06680 [Oscillospiraceae bacterium]|nr:hypothetical protein [Oscillospiraceae bacterium]
MENYAKADLEEALKSISSTVSKCEKAFEKLKAGTPQHTLTQRRIKAFHIAAYLITKELSDMNE